VIPDRASDIKPDDTSGLGIVPETVVTTRTAVIRLAVAIVTLLQLQLDTLYIKPIKS
jgi:hypothetical protein